MKWEATDVYFEVPVTKASAKEPAPKKQEVAEKQTTPQSIMGKYSSQFGSRGRRFTEDFGSKANQKQQEAKLEAKMDFDREVTIHMDQIRNDTNRSPRSTTRRVHRAS